MAKKTALREAAEQVVLPRRLLISLLDEFLRSRRSDLGTDLARWMKNSLETDQEEYINSFYMWLVINTACAVQGRLSRTAREYLPYLVNRIGAISHPNAPRFAEMLRTFLR